MLRSLPNGYGSVDSVGCADSAVRARTCRRADSPDAPLNPPIRQPVWTRRGPVPSPGPRRIGVRRSCRPPTPTVPSRVICRLGGSRAQLPVGPDPGGHPCCCGPWRACQTGGHQRVASAISPGRLPAGCGLTTRGSPPHGAGVLAGVPAGVGAAAADLGGGRSGSGADRGAKGRRRRVLDSTNLEDAAATQDTVTQLVAAIRRVRRLVPGAREVELAARDDNRPGKLQCAWDDLEVKQASVGGWSPPSVLVQPAEDVRVREVLIVDADPERQGPLLARTPDERRASSVT
jgi:hypothetical protein